MRTDADCVAEGVYVSDALELHDAIDAVNVVVTVAEFVRETVTDAVAHAETLADAETDFTLGD